MEPLFTSFYSLSTYFFPRRPKHLPQCPILEYLSQCCSLNRRDRVSHPYNTSYIIIVICTYSLIFVFYVAEEKEKDFGSNNSRFTRQCK
jgi:hypothetical protein